MVALVELDNTVLSGDMKIAENYSFLAKCHVSAFQMSIVHGTWKAPDVGMQVWSCGRWGKMKDQ